jgi:predicted SnoaL-like aldol condensation-catalyzing enzyme
MRELPLMSQSRADRNRKLVLDAFDTLFNRRDYAAAERFWSPNYIQHSAHIPPGREGLFGLIRAVPASLRYETQRVLADEEYVMVHGRFSNTGRARSWIAVDVVRIENGLLKEHWDVLQDEATEKESASGLPMFGDEFGLATPSNNQERI